MNQAVLNCNHNVLLGVSDKASRCAGCNCGVDLARLCEGTALSFCNVEVDWPLEDVRFFQPFDAALTSFCCLCSSSLAMYPRFANCCPAGKRCWLGLFGAWQCRDIWRLRSTPPGQRCGWGLSLWTIFEILINNNFRLLAKFNCNLKPIAILIVKII